MKHGKDFMNLLTRMMAPTANERISAKEALLHPFLLIKSDESFV
jgi:serine/threonine protein kinase